MEHLAVSMEHKMYVTVVVLLLVEVHVNGPMRPHKAAMSQDIGFLLENVRMILPIVEHVRQVHLVALEPVTFLVRTRLLTVEVHRHGLEI